MEMKECTARAYGPTDRIVRSAGGAVIPDNQYGGMIDQPVVTGPEAPRMIRLGKDDRGIGRVENLAVVLLFGRREGLFLSAKRDDSDKPHIGTAASQRQYGIGRRKVEAHGHAAQKGAEASGIERLQRVRQGVVGLTAVGTVTGEGNCGAGVCGHAPKIRLWRGLCNMER